MVKVAGVSIRRLVRALPSASVMLGVTLALVALTACQPGGSQTEAKSERFWSHFRLDAREVEQYPALAAMKPKADAVVIGRFGEFRVGRSIQGDAPEDVVTFLTTDFQITSILVGVDYGASVPIEFLGPADPGQAESEVEQLNAALPESVVVVFLRDKGGAEEGFFRPVNSAGLWTATSRSPVDAPMMLEPPGRSGLFPRELQGISSMEEFVDLIRRL